MIYLAIAGALLTAWRYTRAVREARSFAVLAELPAVIVAGLISGLWLGVSARASMRAIAVAADSTRFSWEGTVQVVMVFAGIGGAVAIAYAGLFRHALDRSGLLFGGLVAVATWFPLARSARQLLALPPDSTAFFLSAGVFIAVMWIPYGFALQLLTPRILAAFYAAARRLSQAPR